MTSIYDADTGVWTASGGIADINTLLAGVTFIPAMNFNANFTIAASVSDGVAEATTGSKAMTGTPVNDAPLATGERLWERLARLTDELGDVGPSGLKDVGAVTALQGVVAETADKGVGAGATLKHVIAGITSQTIDESRTGQHCVRATGKWDYSPGWRDLNLLYQPDRRRHKGPTRGQ